MADTLKMLGIAVLAIISIAALHAIFYAGGYISETASVIDKEIRPAKIQERYEWFQDHKGAIDQAGANIVTMINTAKAINGNVSEAARANWDRTDKQLHAKTITEISGTIANRNNLIREYNVAKSEWNKEIADFGRWPNGASHSRDDFNQFPNSIPEYSYGEELKGL